MEELKVSRFKTVGEKHLFSEIDLMLWSPKVDLVAMTTISGEVVLYRITWQNVWSLPVVEEGVCVSALAWRPDGKVLAVGYNNALVRLYNIEGGFCLHEHKGKQEKVVVLKWMSECEGEEMGEERGCEVKLGDGVVIDARVDELFLPELPPITNKEMGETNKSSDDFKRLKDQNLFNMLLVGSASGSCELYAYGIISISKLHLSDTHLLLQNTTISADLKSFVVFLRDDQQLVLNLYDSSQLQSNQQLLKQTALKLGKLDTLLVYVDEVLTQMTEAWQDILVEIESKLMRFAENKTNGRSLSFEFLRLLLYGSASDDLKHFLQYELTKQAFSKLGRSVQSSYKQMQKLLLKNLHTVTHHIIFHLKNLLSLSRCIDQYGRLGLDSELLTAAVRVSEGVLLKGGEMVVVIEESVRNFNAFYKWLYPTKMNMNGEATVVKMTQQEIDCVAQFLKENFDTSKSRVKLERLGQYLRNEDLSMPMTQAGGIEKVLQTASASFNNNTKSFLPQLSRDKSLLQLCTQLNHNFRAILTNCSSTMRPFLFKQLPSITINFSSAQLSPASEKLSVCCFDGPHNNNNYLSFLNQHSSFFFTFLHSHNNTTNNHVCILKANVASRTIHAANLAFKNSQTGYDQNILDVSFFDHQTITLLLRDNISAKMFLLDLSTHNDLFKEVTSTCSVSDLSQHPLHYISNDFQNSRVCKDMDMAFRPGKMAINGQRKIGTVVSTSKKWIQLYLIDSDDEDDDNADEKMEVLYAAESVPNVTSDVVVNEDDKENSDVYE